MDARQQSSSYAQRPAYPQVPLKAADASQAPSLFQSSSSLASLSSINTTSGSPQVARMQAGSAPLPSPSNNQPMNYFGSIARQGPNSYGPQHHHQQQQQQQQQQQRIPPQSQQQIPPQYVGQRGDGGGMPETAPFLQDFSLVAEAAKRAQMACLSRDLDDIGL